MFTLFGNLLRRKQKPEQPQELVFLLARTLGLYKTVLSGLQSQATEKAEQRIARAIRLERAIGTNIERAAAVVVASTLRKEAARTRVIDAKAVENAVRKAEAEEVISEGVILHRTTKNFRVYHEHDFDRTHYYECRLERTCVRHPEGLFLIERKFTDRETRLFYGGVSMNLCEVQVATSSLSAFKREELEHIRQLQMLPTNVGTT